jgi:hypothetical protein
MGPGPKRRWSTREQSNMKWINKKQNDFIIIASEFLLRQCSPLNLLFLLLSSDQSIRVSFALAILLIESICITCHLRLEVESGPSSLLMRLLNAAENNALLESRIGVRGVRERHALTRRYSMAEGTLARVVGGLRAQRPHRIPQRNALGVCLHGAPLPGQRHRARLQGDSQWRAHASLHRCRASRCATTTFAQ